MLRQNDKKTISWALYDFGNSAFSTTVMAGFFPLFFKSYWSDGASAIDTTARLGTSISLASLIIALITPTLGAMADLTAKKKRFLFIFMVIGVLSTALLGTLGQGMWMQATLWYGLAMTAFSASSVFYDSLLPSLGKGTQLDYASSLGFSLGYLGGGLLFAVNVLMYLKPELFGIADGISAVKLSFFSVAVWWFVFSLPLAKNVPEPAIHPSRMSEQGLWGLTLASIVQLKSTLADLAKNKNLLIFVIAYWLYIDGVYTVMTMAVDYGLSIGIESKHLIAALLVIQFIGFPCTYLFGIITDRFNCRKPILVCIVIYGIGVLAATQMKSIVHFYLLATMVGMVQGGVQSLSRSLFANLIPEEASGEYFGLFNLVGKFASILGPLLIAFFTTITRSSSLGIAGLVILFVSGGWLLTMVKEPHEIHSSFSAKKAH